MFQKQKLVVIFFGVIPMTILQIANFSVTCLVTWPLSGNEAESDFLLIQNCVLDAVFQMNSLLPQKINNILT